MSKLPAEIRDVNLAGARRAYKQALINRGFPGPSDFDRDVQIVGVIHSDQATTVIRYSADNDLGLIAIETASLSPEISDESLGAAVFEKFFPK